MSRESEVQRQQSEHRPVRSKRRISGRLLAELAIIFGGVFGAFVAEDLRQQREDDRRARHSYEALLGEVRTFSDRAPFVVAAMDSILLEWNQERSNGRLVPPPYYREPRAETPPTAIWEATLASGGVLVLEPELFNELAVFYNRLISLSDRYMRYNATTEREILPHLSVSGHFYTADGALGGLYETHVGLLKEVRDEIDQLADEAERVEARIVTELGG